MSASRVRAPIVVRHESGVRFAAQVRSHRIIVDQPRAGGGEDTGPAPIELLGVALGTCVAFYVQQACQARGLPFDDMRVEVQQMGAAEPGRIGSFTVRVILPGEIPAHTLAVLERVAASCPAHNTLSHGAAINVSVEAAATAQGSATRV